MSRQFNSGQTYRHTLSVDDDLIERFAAFSGDRNPLHVDAAAARGYGFAKPVGHGAILVAALSRLIGMELPGAGALWMKQAVEWKAAIFAGDEIRFEVTITAFSPATSVMEIEVNAANQKGETVMVGNGMVKVLDGPAAPAQAAAPERRVAFVTGGSRGIGAAIARRLAADGWAVAVGYAKDADAAKRVAGGLGGQAIAVQADFIDDQAASGAVQAVVQAFGRIDAVVHCATPSLARTEVGQLTYAAVERFLRVYLGGALGLIGAAKASMEAQGFGRVVLIGTSALFGTPPAGMAGYVAAKASLLGLLKGAAGELGPAGITVNMVSPGLTVTDLTADVSARAKEIEARRIPTRRLTDPEDTAALVAFLLGDDARQVNGAHLPVAGGPL